MIRMSPMMKISSHLNPRPSSTITRATSAIVISTPPHSGSPNSSCSATAAPMTSARSQAAMATSAMIHSG